MTNNVWREELAWAAGFYDGEGWSGAQQRARVAWNNRRARIGITQYDPFVLERFRRAVLSLGGVWGPYPVSNGSRRWNFIATDIQHCQAIIAMLWPWLSPIKRAQATEMLKTAVADARGAPGHGSTWTACRRGHDLSGIAWRFNGRQRFRACKKCRADREAHRRLVRKTARAMLSA